MNAPQPQLDHARVMQVLGQAMELPAPQRASFLDSTCLGEPALRQRVEVLLENVASAEQAFDATSRQIARADPEQIGPYEILEPIGEGGMAVVYKAQQHEPVKRIVAIKLIKLGMDTRQFVTRFEAERQALAMMDHPNVARVYDAGATETGRPYFVMELVHGEPLTSYCDRQRLSVNQRLELFRKICLAVQHAHQKGIIHRDLKPSNVLVSTSDDGPLPKIIDFGIAKAIAGRLTDQTLVTEFHQMIGTPQYMSPEQAEVSAADIDTRGDIYALGVILYELLSGTTPLESERVRSMPVTELQRVIREEEPAKPSTRLSSLAAGTSPDPTSASSVLLIASHRGSDPRRLLHMIRGDLDWIVMKCLEKDRARRYGTVAALAEDIENYLQHRPVLATPPSAGYQLRKFVRRNRTGVTASAAIVLLLIAGISVSAWQAIRATRAETNALTERDNARATLDFLKNDVLSASIPAVTRGKPLSVVEALDSAARTIERRFKDQPTIKASIHMTLCGAYRELSRHDAAVHHGRAALDLFTASLAPDDYETLAAVSELGQSLHTVGNVSEADALLTTGLKRARDRYGSDDDMTRRLIASVAKLRLKQGRLEDARRLEQENLELSRQLLGEEHVETLKTMNALAIVLRYQGNLAAAEPLVRAAAANCQRILGEDHPTTVNVMNSLGAVLEEQGKLNEALSTKREVVRLARQVWGDDHHNTIACITNLAVCLQQHERDDQAVPLLCEAIERARRTLGADHHITSAVALNLGRSLDNLGRWNEAEPLFRESAELGRKARGIEHPDVIVSILCYARVLAQHGKIDLAAAQAAEVLPVARRKLGDDHRYSRSLMQEYGLILNKQGKTAEAEALLRESLERGRKLQLRPDDPDMLSSIRAMAEFLMEHKRYAEAEPITAELYLISSTAQITVRNAASNMLLWGQCLNGLEEFGRAEAPLREVHQRLTAAQINDGKQMRAVLLALATVCDHTNRPDEAAGWRAKSSALDATTQPAASR